MRNAKMTVRTRIAVIVAAAAVGLFGATAAHAGDTGNTTPPAPAAATPTPSASTLSQPWG